MRCAVDADRRGCGLPDGREIRCGALSDGCKAVGRSPFAAADTSWFEGAEPLQPGALPAWSDGFASRWATEAAAVPER
jgi:hypothetical protein